MAKINHVAAVEAELAEAVDALMLLTTRIEGLRLQLRLLKQNAAVPDGSATTDRLIAIMTQADHHMSPKEMHAALEESGRHISLNNVNATLSYLVKAKRVVKVGRGLYRPA